MNEQDEQSSGQGGRSDNSISDVSVAFNDSPTLPFSFVGGGEEDRNDDEPAGIEVVSPEDTDDVGENGDNNSTGWPHPASPLSASSAVSPSLDAPETILPKMKITMPFMKAYKAMRGPRDVEPSPLFGCFIKSQKCNEGGSEQETEDDPFRNSGRLLNEVNNAIIRDCIEDKAAYKPRPFSLDVNDDDDFGRQTVFYFDQPIVSLLLSQGTQRLSEDCIVGEFDVDNNGDGITDHLLDHTKLDKGWIKANGPFESEEEDAYVSDDDGDPAEVRISPAIFRALAAGCTLDDVDTLRQSASAEASLRPLTPQDKILKVSMDAKHCNNVVPYCHRRQFDIHTGEELSPVYRIEAGPASSILWSPPGVTPERAGLYLLLLQEGQGEQQQPPRGTGMPWLFQRMAPWDGQVLRSRLYGGVQNNRADGSALTTSPSSAPFSSSSSDLSVTPGPRPRGSNGTGKGKQRTKTFTWSEVNEAVHGCRFDPATGTLTSLDVDLCHRIRPPTAPAGSFCSWGPNSMATGIETERALLQTFRDSWRTIQDGQAANANLVAANEKAQAAITEQARCLANIEHQLAACRAAELARQLNEAKEHYRQQCESERTAQKLRRRRERVVRGINEHLQSVRTTVSETEAQQAQGRELQTVLAQRLHDGEARLERLCRDYDVADAGELSKVLAEQLARMGVEDVV